MSDSSEFKISYNKMFQHVLNYSTVLNAMELELFEYYVNDSENILESMLSKEQDYIQEQITAGDLEPNDSGILAIDYFFKRVRYSHIIYMVSLLDTYLQEVCKRVTSSIGEKRVAIQLKDIKGSQWDSKRKFLSAYGQVHIDDDTWKPIQTLIELRNIIVHENGSTLKLDRHKKNMLNISGITIVGGELAVEANYIHGSFQALKALMRQVEEKVKAAIAKNIDQQK